MERLRSRKTLQARGYVMSTHESRAEAAMAILVVLLIGIILGLASAVIGGCSARFEGIGTLSDAAVDLGFADPADSGRVEADHEESGSEAGPDAAEERALDAAEERALVDSAIDAQDHVDAGADTYDPTYDITTCEYECAYTYDDNPTLEYPWCLRSTHYLMNCCKAKNPTCIQHPDWKYYFCCSE